MLRVWSIIWCVAAAAAAPSTAQRTVQPVLETPPVATARDAADDAAIWVHPEYPTQSLVLGTDKRLGLHVYELDGRLLQTLPDGRLNNVDLRDGFTVGGRSQTLVAASNRTDRTIALYWLDHATRQLSRAADPVAIGLSDPYGLCMYRSADGAHYVFVTDSVDGKVRQWRLRADGGQVTGQMVREFVVGSQTEGCVADDESGVLYLAEEDVGLWRYSARPDGGTRRKIIDRVDGAHGLEADLEGLAIWRGSAGNGYLVVSNQGAGSYAVYELAGDNAFVGLFKIVGNPAAAVDGTSDTDGIDIASASLGPRFPQGLLVVQDGHNELPDERQNFKYVSWAEVAQSLGIATAP